MRGQPCCGYKITMNTRRHELTVWRREHWLLPLEDLARSAGLHPDLVARLVDCGLIEPSVHIAARPLFTGSTIERLRCIMRLRRDLGVNLAGVAVILDLREQIGALRKELTGLRQNRVQPRGRSDGPLSETLLPRHPQQDGKR